MKRCPPAQQLKQLLTELCLRYELSLQTYFNAIDILMNPELPELSNQDQDVVLAALFLSHKLHDVHLISVGELCPEGVNE